MQFSRVISVKFTPTGENLTCAAPPTSSSTSQPLLAMIGSLTLHPPPAGSFTVHVLNSILSSLVPAPPPLGLSIVPLSDSTLHVILIWIGPVNVY